MMLCDNAGDGSSLTVFQRESVGRVTMFKRGVMSLQEFRSILERYPATDDEFNKDVPRGQCPAAF
jgi:hypothetical protein